MLPADRNLLSTAKSCIEDFLPRLKVRNDVLEAFAESILLAHHSNPSGWGVSLFPNLVRLNIGMIETFVISANQLYLVVDMGELDLDLIDLDDVEFYASTPDLYVGIYKSVPGSAGVEFPAQLFPQVKPYLWDAHTLLITKAAATRRHPATRDAHSPGVLMYLRQELKIELPDPVYPLASPKKTAGSGHHQHKVAPAMKAIVEELESRDRDLMSDD